MSIKNWFQTNQRILLMASPLLLVCFLLFNSFNSASTEVPSPLINSNELSAQDEVQTVESVTEEPAAIQVDIKGRILIPGVYSVKEGDRVIDLVDLAGGPGEDADMTAVNLSQKLHDEMVIYIPAAGEEIPEMAVQPKSVSDNSSAEESKINLNQADSSLLQTIPGVGPAKAQAIIDYRESVGNFESIEDIKKISGIGDKTFDKLKESIDVK